MSIPHTPIAPYFATLDLLLSTCILLLSKMCAVNGSPFSPLIINCRWHYEHIHPPYTRNTYTHNQYQLSIANFINCQLSTVHIYTQQIYTQHIYIHNHINCQLSTWQPYTRNTNQRHYLQSRSYLATCFIASSAIPWASLMASVPISIPEPQQQRAPVHA